MEPCQFDAENLQLSVEKLWSLPGTLENSGSATWRGPKPEGGIPVCGSQVQRKRNNAAKDLGKILHQSL